MSLTPKLLQQGAAGSARPVYIEDVFSAFLYTGDSSVRVITNGIDLSGKGGLVWTKSRSSSADHALVDTARGVNNILRPNTTAAEQSATSISQFNSNGYNLYDPTVGLFNNSGTTYVSWTFRKQAKFFDIVTWSGDDTTSRVLNHNLGSPPGVIIIKGLNDTFNWDVLYRVNGNDTGTFSGKLSLSGTGADIGARGASRTSTTFQLNNEGVIGPNVSGRNYVAYLFAHNAGGFGASGNDNVISCGSFTTNGSGNATIELGYEPQFVITKRTTSSGSWRMLDIMRGWSLTFQNVLYPNLTNADGESSQTTDFPYATGFSVKEQISVDSYIYIAIRRGPMKVPTTGTEVFSAETYNGNNTLNREFSFSMRYSDLSWFISRNYPSAPVSISFLDRMRGPLPKLWTGGTNAESTSQANVDFANMEKIKIATLGSFSGLNESGTSFVLYNLKRTPRFFDEVCYTGTGSGTQTISHNLGVTPELTINKSRSGTRGWTVYYNNTTFLRLNETNAGASESLLSPTSTTFNADLGAGFGMNAAETYVTYLFASCPGVSKVGSYTGNGSSQTIDCGFAAGARFVLIKRTNATGDWYTFDTARGIIAGNDPFLKINTTTAEVTAYDAVDPTSAGFIVNNDATNFPINVASATYIFLAIA